MLSIIWLMLLSQKADLFIKNMPVIEKKIEEIEVTPVELTLAINLLVQNPEIETIPPKDDTEFLRLRAALVEASLKNEVFDPQEINLFMRFRGEFGSDLKSLRVRWFELRDCPPMSDSYNFPDSATCDKMYDFNRKFLKYLETRIEFEKDRENYYKVVLEETKFLGEFWDQMRTCRGKYYIISTKRQALKKIKDMLTEEDYKNKRLPFPVPYWRFNELK